MLCTSNLITARRNIKEIFLSDYLLTFLFTKIDFSKSFYLLANCFRNVSKQGLIGAVLARPIEWPRLSLAQSVVIT